MTRPIYQYLEMWDDTAPQSASGFAQDGGTAEMSFLVTKKDGSPLDDIDLTLIPTDVLGLVTTTTPITSGSRKGCRSISTPLCHPYHPWMYALAIIDLRGKGQFTQQDAILSDVFTCGSSGCGTGSSSPLPGFPNFCFYNNYIVKVQFKPLPWNVIDDSCVCATSSGYFLDNDNGSSGATPFTFAPGEWMRYVDVSVTQREDNLTAQQGRMQFNMYSTATGKPLYCYNDMNMPVYVGMPKMFIPNALYKVTWKYVPYRYITSSNSYITGGSVPRYDGVNTWTTARQSWRGRINQNMMTINGTIFPSGSLMYVSYDYKYSTPPVQDAIDMYYVGTTATGGISQTFQVYDKLVDVTLVFLTTTRNLQIGETTSGILNRSYVQAGFNLEPWYGDRLCHMALSNPLPSQENCPALALPRMPSFLSAPLELLTTDPDVPNGGV